MWDLVWPVIPFAAINLKAAAKGINANLGTHFLAICSSMLGVAWLIFWIWGTCGILAYIDDKCDAKYGIHDTDEASISIEVLHNATRWLKKKEVEAQPVHDCGQAGVFILLSLCNYWTYLVLVVGPTMSIPCC